ncbi:MAG: ABC transporter substrate-binding protein [Sulfuricella sp.]|nr:ABC transporter substrate-binding protein [Sulfuricella sp.]
MLLLFVRLFCLSLLASLPTYANDARLETVSVQLIWKHQFEFAAFYAAQERGYYRNAGLSVRIQEGGPGIDAIKEVISGKADFGVGTSSLVVERFRGEPVVALATLMQHSPIALLARRSSEIRSVHDLANRPVATDTHNRDEIEAYLRASGIADKDIHLTTQTDWSLESLHQGKEAAKVVYVSNEPFWIRGHEHEYLLLTPRSVGIDLFGNMLFTTEAQIQARPQVVRAFREATLKGLVYALEHPQEIADLIVARYNTQHKSREHLLFEAAQIRELTRPDIVEPGYMSPGRWRHVIEVYASQDKMAADFNPAGFIYDPEPRTLPGWLIAGLLAAIFGMLLAFAIVIKVRSLNIKLKQEIGERTQAEAALLQSEAKYRELVHNAGAIILRMAPDGTLTYFNEYAEHFFGYAAEEILGKHVVGTIVPLIESGSQRNLSVMVDSILGSPGHYAENVNENITRSGRRVMIHWSNRVILDETHTPVGLLCIGHDITAKTQLEKELAEYRQHLEELVTKRTVELETARHDAERLARVKSEFLANMSHEIRTPLNGVLGFAQIGMRVSDKSGKAGNYFAKIIHSSELLLGVINDILDFSKMEAGQLKVEHVNYNLEQVLAETLDLLKARADAKGLQLHLETATECPANVMGDPLRVQQVLLNLLSNAVKFTETGQIALKVTRQDERLIFSISDTGIGMNEVQLGHLFVAFTQADSSTTRQYGGTGLGLAISKRLVELMAGNITVSSRVGVGSTFEVSLPFIAAADSFEPPLPATSASSSGCGHLTGLVILAAEDNEINQMVLEELLAGEGCELMLTGNGQMAVDMVRRHGPSAFNLVLMDVQMPVMNGYDAARHIHALDPELPIVGQTAHALQEERDKCLRAGMVDQLCKPFDQAQLIEIIRKWARPSALTSPVSEATKPRP